MFCFDIYKYIVVGIDKYGIMFIILEYERNGYFFCLLKFI